MSRNTLDLVGDGDDIDLLREVEATFGVTITDNEAARLYTVGDLHDLICEKRSVPEQSPCLTAQAFRMIAPEIAGGRRISPSTRLDTLAGDRRVIDWLRKIDGQSDFDLLTDEHPAVFPLLLIFIALPFALAWLSFDLIGSGGVLWFLLWGGLGHLSEVLRRLPRTLPPSIRTVGDLVRETLPLNYRHLAAHGATGGRRDVWLLTLHLCRQSSGHAGRIDRSTTFFAEHAT